MFGFKPFRNTKKKKNHSTTQSHKARSQMCHQQTNTTTTGFILNFQDCLLFKALHKTGQPQLAKVVNPKFTVSNCL